MLTGKKNNHFELNAGGFLGRVKLSDDDGYPFMSPIFNVGAIIGG